MRSSRRAGRAPRPASRTIASTCSLSRYQATASSRCARSTCRPRAKPTASTSAPSPSFTLATGPLALQYLSITAQLFVLPFTLPQANMHTVQCSFRLQFVFVRVTTVEPLHWTRRSVRLYSVLVSVRSTEFSTRTNALPTRDARTRRRLALASRIRSCRHSYSAVVSRVVCRVAEIAMR